MELNLLDMQNRNGSTIYIYIISFNNRLSTMHTCQINGHVKQSSQRSKDSKRQTCQTKGMNLLHCQSTSIERSGATSFGWNPTIATSCFFVVGNCGWYNRTSNLCMYTVDGKRHDPHIEHMTYSNRESNMQHIASLMPRSLANGQAVGHRGKIWG